MPKFPQGLGFDLPDAFARHFEILSDFFQGMIGGLADPKPFSQDLFLARRKRFQRAVDLPLQVIANGRFQRRHGLLVFNEIAQMAVFFLTDRCFERNRLAGDLQNLPTLSSGRSMRSAISSGAAHGLASARDGGSSNKLIDRFNHVNGNPDRSSLIRNGAGDRLPNPPSGVGTEFVPALIFEFIDRFHQADIAFLNQIEELETSVRVFLCNTDHKPQIRFDQLGLPALHFLFGKIEMLDRILDLFSRNKRFFGFQLTDSLWRFDRPSESRPRASSDTPVFRLTAKKSCRLRHIFLSSSAPASPPTPIRRWQLTASRSAVRICTARSRTRWTIRSFSTPWRLTDSILSTTCWRTVSNCFLNFFCFTGSLLRCLPFSANAFSASETFRTAFNDSSVLTRNSS